MSEFIITDRQGGKFKILDYITKVFILALQKMQVLDRRHIIIDRGDGKGDRDICGGSNR